MISRDLIFYEANDKIKLDEVLQEALRNVLLSLPFVDSFHLFNNKKALIESLMLNRIPAVLFKLFAEEHNLNIQSSTSNFWQKPVFDFLYHKTAFKIMHQWVETENNLAPEEYLYLPALIPNRFEDDIWQKRIELSDRVEKNEFLFTFMHRKRETLTDIKISSEILKFLSAVATKYGKWEGRNKPYCENVFWSAFAEKGELPNVSLAFIPKLIIAGVAGENEFSFFADTDDKTNHAYRLYHSRWYEIERGGGLSFCNGLIQTRIKNATCPMEALPSFKTKM